MKIFFWISFFIVAAITSPAQIPGAPEIKSNNIKKITINDAIGEKQLLFDKNGEMIRELHEGNFFAEREIFYNNNQKPDSIINKSQLSFLNHKKYFFYSADSSCILLTVYKESTDTLYLGKDNKKLRQQSSDGSKINYDYNAKKQLIKTTTVVNDGKIETEQCAYDLNGNVVKKVFNSGKANSITTVFTYNAKKMLLTSKATGTGGFLLSTNNTRFEYNLQGLLAKEISVSGTFKNTATYKYESY